MKAAIYHFTDSTDKRPQIYIDQLERLKTFAVSHGYPDVDTYCDNSLRKCDCQAFEELLTKIDNYDALIVKDCYHINKCTMTAIDTIKQLIDKGVQVITLDDGAICFDEGPFDTPLRVATYCCRFGSGNGMHDLISVQNDILSLFAKKKTRWTVVDQFYDDNDNENKNNSGKKRIMDIVANRDKYDLLLVHNLNAIHWRTANFFKLRDLLQMDIYSLQEGYLKYPKEKHV